MPRRDEAIGRHVAVQRAGGRTVDVVQIRLDDAAETADVEPRVAGQQRIAGPLDQVDAAGQRALALRQLEPQAERPAARLRRDAEQVRPLHHAAVAQAGHGEHAADEPAALVLGADQDAAGLRRDDELRSRHDVVVVRRPTRPAAAGPRRRNRRSCRGRAGASDPSLPCRWLRLTTTVLRASIRLPSPRLWRTR